MSSAPAARIASVTMTTATPRKMPESATCRVSRALRVPGVTCPASKLGTATDSGRVVNAASRSATKKLRCAVDTSTSQPAPSNSGRDSGGRRQVEARITRQITAPTAQYTTRLGSVVGIIGGEQHRQDTDRD